MVRESLEVMHPISLSSRLIEFPSMRYVRIKRWTIKSGYGRIGDVKMCIKLSLISQNVLNFQDHICVLHRTKHNSRDDHFLWFAMNRFNNFLANALDGQSWLVPLTIKPKLVDKFEKAL